MICVLSSLTIISYFSYSRMLRKNSIRLAWTVSCSAIGRITTAHTGGYFIRFESSTGAPGQSDAAKAAWRQARDLKDKLNHNWDTATLTYEQVKPKTLSPSPVCLYFRPCGPVLIFPTGRISHRRTRTKRSDPRVDPILRQLTSLCTYQLAAPFHGGIQGETWVR
jgi:hypothetical protein